MSEWISVRDRLPEIGEEVFVLILSADWGITYDIGYIHRPGFWDTVWYDSKDLQSIENDFITHWMPIPKLPSDCEDADLVFDDLLKKWGHKTKCCKCGKEFEVRHPLIAACDECRSKINSLKGLKRE